jgi:hypothetical protein
MFSDEVPQDGLSGAEDSQMHDEYKKDKAQSEPTRSRQVRGSEMKDYRMSCQEYCDQEPDNPHVPASGLVSRW